MALLPFAALGAVLEPNLTAGELAHEVDRLSTTGRVLYVAAHPDDENTRLLAYLSNHRHLVVGYLSMTRGGGGQNLIGGEQGELLDAVRTAELLAARRMDGAVQFFSRAQDFGYSKSAEETLRRWGHEEVLADVVRVIRTFQPDVVITRFNERPPNHGHHTASALLAREAFLAASDPARFPEQLAEGLVPWRPTRLLHNFPTWRGDAPPKDALRLEVGGYDPRLGLDYGELAARSRSQHKSQGFGAAGERGPLAEHFVTVAGSAPKRDLMEGIDLRWGRFGGAGKKVDRAMSAARSGLHRDRPEQALAGLVQAHRAFDQLEDSPRVRQAKAGLERVIAAASGLFVRVTASRPGAVPGSELELAVEVLARRPSKVILQQLDFPGGVRVEAGRTLVPGEKVVLEQAVRLDKGAQVSVPHWLRAARAADGGGGAPAADLWSVLPLGPPPLAVGVAVNVEGRPLHFEVPVEYAWTDRVHGERVRTVQVVPPATVTPTREAVLSANGGPAAVELRIRAGGDGVKGEVSLRLPPGWRSAPSALPLELPRAGDEVTVRFQLTPQKGAGPGVVQPFVRVGEREWAYREDVIDYPHLPLQQVLQPSSLRVATVALELSRARVGYLPGPGDTAAEDLAHVGMQVEVLDEATLRGGELGRYAAIVVGIRAYNSRPELRALHPRLMRYVEEGGTVVVQYQTTSRWAPLDQPLGPYPFTLGSGRVTDEGASLVALDPSHPLLRTPNRLGPEDFEGWVQERGLYFAERWDPRYAPLFKVADPGEEPLEGSTLWARHGKGRYVYTGLAFFRQLRAGVPGAYRLFANLLAPEPPR